MFEALQLAACLLLGAMSLGLALFVRQQARCLNLLAATVREERAAREEMARDLAALLDCSRTIGGRVRDQAARQKSVLDRVNEIAQHVDGTPAIEHVERLMADGLGVDQIKRVCELSQGEAQLLERWKRHRSAA
jgi:hypothetical protein